MWRAGGEVGGGEGFEEGALEIRGVFAALFFVVEGVVEGLVGLWGEDEVAALAVAGDWGGEGVGIPSAASIRLESIPKRALEPAVKRSFLFFLFCSRRSRLTIWVSYIQYSAETNAPS